MNILIACEESQTECIAFRARGHNAFSCDLQDCSGGHPEWHIKDDVLNHLNDGWDMMIAHPPCTYLSAAGAPWLYRGGKINEERMAKLREAAAFFMELYNADIPKIAIENPRDLRCAGLPPYTQEIQPFQFGEPYRKTTRLWLKNLPPLVPTKVIKPMYYWVSCGKNGANNGGLMNKAKDRSKSFKGIAEAMAETWGARTASQRRRS